MHESDRFIVYELKHSIQFNFMLSHLTQFFTLQIFFTFLDKNNYKFLNFYYLYFIYGIWKLIFLPSTQIPLISINPGKQF